MKRETIIWLIGFMGGIALALILITTFGPRPDCQAVVREILELEQELDELAPLPSTQPAPKGKVRS